MARAYYNEIDPYAAQWLRNLIAAGHIAPGDVDERSIVDVRADDLRGYRQCHFFAGVGVWSYALRLAGWPDDWSVWTGSCPCQPFSAAGKGEGIDDERHLWPAWFRLIEPHQPRVVFGEQVASKGGLAWLDIVCADLEGARYTVRPADLCAAGFGAPHIRQRLFFVADAQCGARQQHGLELADTARGAEGARSERQRLRDEPRDGSVACAVADSDGRDASAEWLQRGREHGLEPQDGGAGGMGNAVISGREGCRPGIRSESGDGGSSEPSPTAGFWRDCDWLPCTDGKARPVEPGSFPLAHGIVNRVGRLRAYGNAIVAPVAAEFIGAYMNTRSSGDHGG